MPSIIAPKKVGVLLGGSGLIGGAITHYFKKIASRDIELVAPNSKKLSLRVPDDIKQYFKKIKPDFIINTAIASLDSDPQLSLETNYIGSINLAKAAISLKIPYIHFSSSATMPNGLNLSEDTSLALTPELTNYAKSKLMAELTLKHLWENEGLDCTIIRLGVVYGKHDHKIQGFHRLFYSIVDQAMPFMMTKRGVLHSYTNARNIPAFVHYILDNRKEFSGQIYNFVDRNPIDLSELILTIKSYLQLSLPKEIFVPYPLAKTGRAILSWLIKKLSFISIEARIPAELMFLENFYISQTLSTDKLANSSYGLPEPGKTVFTELPDMIEYYLTRWEHLNLISSFNEAYFHPQMLGNNFSVAPNKILQAAKENKLKELDDFAELREKQYKKTGCR
jgi:nucleoside-diphosphate-sugar epimerase